MKKPIKSIFPLLLVFTLSACVSLITPKVQSDVTQLRSGQYQLDTRHTALIFKIRHLGLSTYVGRFNEVSATLDFDPQNLAATKLEAIIDMASLEINDPDLAQRLMGRTWFNQKQFPTATFKTLNVTPINDTEFEFVGTLNFRGVEKPLAVRAKFNGGANNLLTGKYTLGFDATASFLRSDFGMKAFIPIVGDEIKLEAFAEFQRN